MWNVVSVAKNGARLMWREDACSMTGMEWAACPPGFDPEHSESLIHPDERAAQRAFKELQGI